METGLTDIGAQIQLPRLYERDIDVLLQEELIFNEKLQTRFAQALGISEAFVVNDCRLSAVDSTGEVDVLVNVSIGGRRGILLIENKIDAAFQPRQPERYRERANTLSNQDCTAYCVLVAPSYYLGTGSGELKHFDTLISYEDIASAIRSDGAPRSPYRAALILRALEQARNAYAMVPSEEVGDLWTRIYDIARVEYPILQMAPPSKKGSQSKWLIFKADLPPRITIDWKITKGTVDLSFWKGARPCPSVGTDLTKIPEAGVLTLGDTIAISISLPKPPAEWTEMSDAEIRNALTAAQSLLAFYRSESANFA